MPASMTRRLPPGPRGPGPGRAAGGRGQARRAAVRPELDGLPPRPGGLRPAAPTPGRRRPAGSGMDVDPGACPGGRPRPAGQGVGGEPLPALPGTARPGRPSVRSRSCPGCRRSATTPGRTASRPDPRRHLGSRASRPGAAPPAPWGCYPLRPDGWAGRAPSWRSGRIEREVIAAAEGDGLLVLARDGDRAPPGTPEPGTGRRLVIDHAPARSCWSGPNPRRASRPSPASSSAAPPAGCRSAVALIPRAPRGR